ncbi:MAG: butyrate kinase [Clostridiales bacterium]|jgi:butyrate kinase|nr:butyrate kinase [Clostridiales bacterium]
MKILIVNPGSTSTKMGLYDGEALVFEHTLRHEMSELAPFGAVANQYDFRMQIIAKELENRGIKPEELSSVVGMGGLLAPLDGGTYLVNDTMVADLKSGKYGEHASNLGGLIARALADAASIPAYIVDPVVVDEMEDIFRISGHPKLARRSVFHALNHKATARKYCAERGKKYNEVNLIVVHMGGGISVALHSNGRAIDTNNALGGCGPFTPERSGGLPAGDLAALCFSGDYSHDEVKAMLVGKGGMAAYFGTNSMLDIENRAKNEPEVKLVMEAMALQIAKEIATMAASAAGQVEAILLTGGIARAKPITDEVARRISFIAPVHIYPGEDELAALAGGALRVLRGEEEAKIYEGLADE